MGGAATSEAPQLGKAQRADTQGYGRPEKLVTLTLGQVGLRKLDYTTLKYININIPTTNLSYESLLKKINMCTQACVHAHAHRHKP